jgi:5-methylcytosine-specific restriction enzyme subunit McrC
VIESITIWESRPAILKLNPVQRDRLIKVGKSLASNSSWWGGDVDNDVDRTVITCEPVSGSQYRIRVADAVGAIGLPGLIITVQPKIPLAQFLYVLAEAGAAPRYDPDSAQASPEPSFWELVATWFIDAAEGLIRHGLIKDYRETAEVLPIARGRIRALPTAQLYYAGRVAVDCRYDEFDHDNPLNRLLKAAAVTVAGSPLLGRPLRRRASLVVSQLNDVSEHENVNLDVVPDLRASYYRDPIDLAKRIIQGQGVAPHAGERTARTFLVRTPDLIETGIRNILVDGLAPNWKLEQTPHGRQIEGARMTLNPDLIFESGAAVGDLKYKIPSVWDRGDLYQAVVFATGFRARHACVVHFALAEPGEDSILPELGVGDVRVQPFVWNASQTADPAVSGANLVQQVITWLGEALGHKSPPTDSALLAG